MARLASVSLLNSRPSLTPMVSISLIVSTPCRKRPPHAGLVMKQLPFYLYSNDNTHCTAFIHTFQRVFKVLLYFIATCMFICHGCISAGNVSAAVIRLTMCVQD